MWPPAKEYVPPERNGVDALDPRVRCRDIALWSLLPSRSSSAKRQATCRPRGGEPLKRGRGLGATRSSLFIWSLGSFVDSALHRPQVSQRRRFGGDACWTRGPWHTPLSSAAAFNSGMRHSPHASSGAIPSWSGRTAFVEHPSMPFARLFSPARVWRRRERRMHRRRCKPSPLGVSQILVVWSGEQSLGRRGFGSFDTLRSSARGMPSRWRCCNAGAPVNTVSRILSRQAPGGCDRICGCFLPRSLR